MADGRLLTLVDNRNQKKTEYIMQFFNINIPKHNNITINPLNITQFIISKLISKHQLFSFPKSYTSIYATYSHKLSDCDESSDVFR